MIKIIRLPVEEPVGDLVLSGVLHDGHDLVGRFSTRLPVDGYEIEDGVY